ncbi:Feruloyl esterase [Thecaphora frezii]|nr:putative feruloyl esterase b [Thecaphora frezii]
MRFAAPSVLVALLYGSVLRSWGHKSTDCKSLRPPTIDGVKYNSILATEFKDVPYKDSTTKFTYSLTYCEINITLSHPPAQDQVIVSTWLPPASAWNGRFQGTGGGGYRAGRFGVNLAPAVALGYSAVSTDAGVGDSGTGSFLLNTTTNEVDYTLLTNFASRSLHEMTVIGKALSRDYYGKKHFKSYWNGCSTGGRQGLMEAQRYPGDYDGILAGAPAINWNKFTTSSLISDILRLKLGYEGPACELEAIRTRAIEACDALDGKKDGIVAALDKCHFNATSLVGKTFTCDSEGGATRKFSKESAAVANAVWHGLVVNGKRVWYGFGYDTNLTVVSGIDTTFSAKSAAWTTLAVLKQPNYNLTSLRDEDLARLIGQSYAEYNDLIGTDNADLWATYKHGTKVLSYHGTADQAFPSYGTVDYWVRVRDFMKRQHSVDVDDFYRLFLAQSVGHCRGGVGPFPTDPLGALVEWVENGQAPERLPAKTQDAQRQSQPLCKFPLMPVYTDSKADGGVTCKKTAFSNFKSLPAAVPVV